MKLVLLSVVGLLGVAFTQDSPFQVVYNAEITTSSSTCQSSGVANLSAVLTQFSSCDIPGTYSSCQDIIDNCGRVASGMYQLQTDAGTVNRYCDMEGSNCGGTGGWMRVALVDMSDPIQSCPVAQNLSERTFNGVRMCVYDSATDFCTQVNYGVDGVWYSQVCGRVRGYQFGTPDGFGPYRNQGGGRPLSAHYLDGISITYGDPDPEGHIWSFPVGKYESSDDYYGCPCNIGNRGYIPAYVGNDYYCESGQHTNPSDFIIYETDPLYDGDGCGGLEGPCCTNYPNLPWFVKTLNAPTNKQVNTRYCINNPTKESITMDQLELYIR